MGVIQTVDEVVGEVEVGVIVVSLFDTYSPHILWWCVMRFSIYGGVTSKCSGFIFFSFMDIEFFYSWPSLVSMPEVCAFRIDAIIQEKLVIKLVINF